LTRPRKAPVAGGGPYAYLTLSEPSRSSLRERASRFFAFAYPVQTREEIDGYLQSLRKEFPDATHHCYAWILGAGGKDFKAHDDGEPRHSAGDPILGQIRSKGLTNVLVVVVRYFGGVKLGVAGLTRAYREVTRALLDGATRVHAQERLVIQLECLFEAVPDVMKLIKEFELEVQGQTFEDKARFVLRIGRNSIDLLRQRIQQVSAKGQRTISLQVL
jgi:uncharacterized YigZ family protein